LVIFIAFDTTVFQNVVLILPIQRINVEIFNNKLSQVIVKEHEGHPWNGIQPTINWNSSHLEDEITNEWTVIPA